MEVSWQLTGIPVIFVSALEGKGRLSVMRQVIDTYEKWCRRLPTARLYCWLLKVCSNSSISPVAMEQLYKYIFGFMMMLCVGYEQTFMERSVSSTQGEIFHTGEARPPTFVAFVSGKVQLSDTDLRFLTKSLKEDFDLGGIPVRIMQRNVTKRSEGKSVKSSKTKRAAGRMNERMVSDKRSPATLENSVSA